MFPVSADFLSEIKASPRTVYGKAAIDYTDPFLDQSITVAVNEEAAASHKDQVADALTTPTKKYVALDGTWVLDGTFSLPPADPLNGQQGWWGATLAGAGGVFTTYPTLTVTFAARPIDSLKVVGDSQRAEYPVDFAIKLYNAANTLLYTHTVTANALVSWTASITVVTQVTKMTLEISKWSHAGRCVKILEFFTSIQQVYEGNDILISINLLEERETSRGSLPVGNISSNEIKITLRNDDRRFDAGNTASSLYGLLKANRRIKAWLGEMINAVMEWVPLGVFWSGDWTAPEDGVQASTTGRDRLELLRKSTYSTSTVQTNQTLYALAVAVLQDAGLAVDEYFIDTELQDYTVPYSYFGSMSHREALRIIAEAALGQVYCDRNGIIRVEGESYYKNIGFEQGWDTQPYTAGSTTVNSNTGGILNVTSTTSDPQLLMYSLGSFDPAVYKYIEIRYKVVSGVPNTTTIYFTNALYSSANGAQANAATLIADGEWHVLYIDMSTHANWLNSDITGWRYDWCNGSGATMELDYIRLVKFIPNTGFAITQDDYFTKDNPPKSDGMANYIEVETQPLRPDVAAEVYKSNDPVTVSAGQSYNLTAYYNNTPCINAAASLTGATNTTITNATYYAWGANLTLTNAGATDENVTVIINATPLKILNQEKAIAQDVTSIVENGKIKFTFPANPLIQTVARAQAVANSLLANYKDPRRDLTTDWRGNPALLLGDRVTVTDRNGSVDYFVTKQDMDYDGSLRAKLEGKKAT